MSCILRTPTRHTRSTAILSYKTSWYNTWLVQNPGYRIVCKVSLIHSTVS